MNTHNDIQPLQAREALQEVNNQIKVRTNRVKKQNLHGVHFGCQADSNLSLENKDTQV